MERVPTFAWWLAYTMPTVLLSIWLIKERYDIVVAITCVLLIYLVGAAGVILGARKCNSYIEHYEKEIEKEREETNAQL